MAMMWPGNLCGSSVLHSMENYKQYAKQLLANGYTPIPIKQGQKRPAVKDWAAIKVDGKQVDQWSNGYFSDCGIGLRGGKLVAVDIDITDKTTTRALLNWCNEHIGPGLVRVGLAPKLAIFYRTDSPHGRIDSPYYNGGRHTSQHIEIRSLDTQTVAFGMHPETQRPYSWVHDKSPINTKLSSLPLIAKTDIDNLFQYLAELAESNEWALQADSTGLETGDGEWMKGKYDISDTDLAAALGHINADEYHRWVTVGQALYHQYDGNAVGLDLWDVWSSASDKYEPGACEDKWHSFHVVGRRSTVTAGSIISLAQAAGWLNPGPDTTTADEFPTGDPEDVLAPFRVGDMLTTAAPPIKWLIRDFMPANKVCLLTAPGGTGKSLFTLQLAFSVSGGATLAGQWTDIEPGSTLVVSAEDDRDDVHRRLQAILETYTDDFSLDTDYIDHLLQAVTAGFHHISMVGKNAHLTHKKGNQCELTEGVTKIITLARAIPDLKLIIFDPVSRFRGGDENSQEDVTRFVEALEKIKQATGATILAVHHANKASMREGGADQQYAARGASALTDGVRFQLNMAAMHADDAEKYGVGKDQTGRYVKLAVAKTNYTAPYEGLWLERDHGGVLCALDMDAVKYRQDKDARANTQDSILALIKESEAEGKPVSKRRFCDLHSGAKNMLGLANNRLRSYLDMMIEDGLVLLIDSGKAGGSKVMIINPEEEESDGT